MIELSLHVACAGIRNSLQRISGQYCTVDDDCLGFSCCTPLTLIFSKKFARAAVRVDPCHSALTVSLGSWKQTFNISYGMIGVSFLK